MLTKPEKKIINDVLEDYSELVSIKVCLEKQTAEIIISIIPDEETNKIYELGDLTWRLARNNRIAFELSGLAKIRIKAMGRGDERRLPKELAAVNKPSPEFMLFLVSLFETEPIFEWNCFGNPPYEHQKTEFEAYWGYEFPGHSTQEVDYIQFYKEKYPSLWVIGLWFSDFSINAVDGEISVAELGFAYPKRLEVSI